MSGRVIQGCFPAARVRVSPSVLQAMPLSLSAPALSRAGSAPTVQRFGAPGEFQIDPSRLGLVDGGGQALPQSVRKTMENAFGADFSTVRVHTGPQAERLGALAFTVGTDIYFAPGRFQPDSMQGKQLLGHELAHVIQQRQGRVRPPGASGISVVQDHALEAEADRLAQRAATHVHSAKNTLQPRTLLPIPAAGPAPHRNLPGFVQPSAPVRPASGNLPSRGHGILQPKGGAKALKKLAQPKVFPGPEIPAQTAIVEALEKKVDQKLYPVDKEKLKSVICLGAVELPDDLNADKGTLINSAKMIELPNVKITGPSPDGRNQISGFFPDSSVDQHFELVKGETTLQNNIKTLVIGTMIAAGQMDYLKTVDWAKQGVRIFVEVHYYRERNPEQQAFHKDTLGQTLFVNLNFVTEDSIVGPEFVLNPPSVEGHDEQMKSTLPARFQKHLATVRGGLGDPTEIGATRIKPNEAVAFVDELIHHKTPTYGHRQVSSSELGKYLKANYPKEYKRAEDRSWYRSYYLGIVPKARLNAVYYGWGKQAYNDELKWDEWLKVASDKNKRYDRVFLRTKGFSDDLIDGILGEDLRFKHVSIPNTKRSATTGKPLTGHSGPVVSKNRPPLKRQMSALALNNELPPQSTKPRRFFRTWVRAIPL